jgi:putative endonuclease
MYYVYVIQHDITKATYIGFTANLEKRIIEHNTGSNKSTKRNRGSWKVIYAEAYRSRLDAQTRERRLKNHGSGKQELFKRLAGSWLEA